MIQMEYIIDNDKTLLTIVFNKKVIDYMKCKCDDSLIVFQSKFNPKYFLLVKADKGYRITKFPRMKKTYQINVSHKLQLINEFALKDCSYFLKKNSTIRMILN